MIVKPIFGSTCALPDLTSTFCNPKLRILNQMISQGPKKAALPSLREKVTDVKTVDDLVSLFLRALKIAHAQKRQRELREVFNALLKLHQMDQALALVEQVFDPLERSFLLKRASQIFLEQGEVKKAFEVAKVIPDLFQRSLAIHRICFALAMERQTSLAFEMAKAIPDLLTQSHTIKIISEVLLEEEKPRDALYVIDLMQEGQEKDYALEHVIRVFTKKGIDGDLFDLIEKIQDDFIRSKAAMILLKAFLKVGRIDEPIQLTNKMPCVSVRLRGLRKIQDVLLRQGEIKSAEKLILRIFLCQKKQSPKPTAHLSLIKCPSIPQTPFSFNESPLIEEIKILEDFLVHVIEKFSADLFSKRYLKQKDAFEAICHKLYVVAEFGSERLQKERCIELENQVQNQLKTIAPLTLEMLRKDLSRAPEICLRFLDPIILTVKANRIMYSNKSLPPLERLFPDILSYNAEQLTFLCKKLEEENLSLALAIALKVSDLRAQSSLLQTISSPFRWKKNLSEATKIAELIPLSPIRKLSLQVIDSFISAKGGDSYTDS